MPREQTDETILEAALFAQLMQAERKGALASFLENADPEVRATCERVLYSDRTW